MDTHCPDCNKQFSRPQDLQRHFTTASHTRKRRAQEPSGSVLVKKARTAQPVQSPQFGIRLIHRGMGDLFKVYRAQFKRVFNDITLLVTVLAAHIIYLIERAVSDTNGIKAQLRCTATFYKDRQPEITKTKYFSSKQHIFLHSTNNELEYAMAMAQIHRQIEECTFQKLPKNLALKKAIVNVKNDDNRCFLWSILAKIHHDSVEEVRNPDRISHYTYLENSLDMNGINYPVAITDIQRIEEQNDLAINVFGYGQGLYPLYITKDRSKEPINLLLLSLLLDQESRPPPFSINKV